MLFCSSVVFAENDITAENENNQVLESVEAEAPVVEASTEVMSSVAPMPEAAPAPAAYGSNFDYHKYIDAIYVNYGIMPGSRQFLGFDIGKDFFVDFNYSWGSNDNDKLSLYCVGLGFRPTMWFSKYFMFQAKLGAEYHWGTGSAVGGNKTAGNIACLIEPRFGVKIGSGGLAASYRFDVNKFKFRNTIGGHLCVSAFFYI